MRTRRGNMAVAGDANMEYDQKTRRVRQLLRELDKQLYKHEARQGNRMEDWGFVGDLGHVEEELEELLRFIGGGRRGA